MKRRLLTADAGEGGDPTHQTPADTSAHLITQPPAAPPPVAHAVITGTKSEREIELEREKDELAKKLKDRETEVATVSDQFTRYKQTVESPQPVPVKSGKIKSRMFTFGRDDQE